MTIHPGERLPSLPSVNFSRAQLQQPVELSVFHRSEAPL
jgi:hypothetical protein